MFSIISDYKHLYVADFSKIGINNYKIVYSNVGNLSVDGSVMIPFVQDVETGFSILVNSSNHIKKLSYYVNYFGFPKKRIALGEKDKQRLIVDKVKLLKKNGRI